MPSVAYTTKMCTLKTVPDETCETAAEFLAACAQEGNNVFERIPDDVPVHPYFDVDYDNGKAFTPDGEAIAFDERIETDLLDVAKAWLTSMFQLTFGGFTPTFCVASATSPDYISIDERGNQHRKWKVSLHIIVTNCLMLKKQLKNFVLACNSMMQLDPLADRVYGYSIKEIFDEAVYSKNRKMRALGASKPGERRPLRLLEGKPEESIITNLDPEGTWQVLDFQVSEQEITAAAKNWSKADTGCSPEDLEKFHAYMSLIDKEHYNTNYMNWFKLQRACANIGIPFEEYDKYMRGCIGYDFNKNFNAYQEVNDDTKGRLGWRHIYLLAQQYSPKEKAELDKRFRTDTVKLGGSKECSGVFTDQEASEKLFKLYPHWKYCERKLYAFDETTGMWSDSKAVHDSIVIRFSKELHVASYEKKRDGKTEVVVSPTRSYGSMENLRNKVYSGLVTLCRDDDWLKQNQLSSLKKLLFRNGYFDAVEGKFYHKDEHGFNPDILFFACIPHDYEEFDAEGLEYMDGIKKRLFRDPLGEGQGDFLLLNIARGLMGDMMKRFLMGIGTTNSGKSILTTAIQTACGKYAATFNAENLAMRHNSDGDEAKAMRWMLLLRNARLILSNELKTDTVLNGNMLKKLSSGGDTLCGRTHGQEETEFVSQALPIVFANDVPDIRPLDDAVDGRLRVVSFKKSFVENPSNEFELKKDPGLEDEIRTARFQKALVGLFIREYMYAKEHGVPAEPAEVLAAKKEWVGDDNDPLGKILAEFKVTNNPEHYVPSSHIQHVIDTLGLGMKMKKFGSMMAKHVAIHKLDNVKNGQKHLGKTVAVWFGIAKIDPEEAKKAEEEAEKKAKEEAEKKAKEAEKKAKEEEKKAKEEAKKAEEEEKKPVVEEEAVEEEEIEVLEMEVDGVTYYTDNDITGALYEVLPNGDVGKKVGKIKDGDIIWE